MRKITLVFLPLLFLCFFSVAKIAFAHPGNTASDGCHYCRTNCAKWGEVEDARHCHGGSSDSAPVYSYSAPTSAPVPTATPRPTKTPSPKPTNTPNPTDSQEQTFYSESDSIAILTPTPQVAGASSATENSSSGGYWGTLITGVLGYYGYKKLKLKRLQKQK